MFSLIGMRLFSCGSSLSSFPLRTGWVMMQSAWALALQPCTFDPFLLELYYNLSYVNAWQHAAY